MGARINMMIENDVLKLLKHVPAGKRSQLVNFALRDWFQRQKRQSVAKKMDKLRSRLPEISSQKIMAILHEIRREKQ